MKTNVVFSVNGKRLTVLGYDGVPPLSAVVHVPVMDVYGLVVAVERDNERQCLRSHPIGEVIDIAQHRTFRPPVGVYFDGSEPRGE